METLADLNNLYAEACKHGEPKIISCSQADFESYRDLLPKKARWENEPLREIGVKNILFNGVPVCPLLGPARSGEFEFAMLDGSVWSGRMPSRADV